MNSFENQTRLSSQKTGQGDGAHRVGVDYGPRPIKTAEKTVVDPKILRAGPGRADQRSLKIDQEKIVEPQFSFMSPRIGDRDPVLVQPPRKAAAKSGAQIQPIEARARMDHLTHGKIKIDSAQTKKRKQ